MTRSVEEQMADIERRMKQLRRANSASWLGRTPRRASGAPI